MPNQKLTLTQEDTAVLIHAVNSMQISGKESLAVGTVLKKLIDLYKKFEAEELKK